MRDKADQTATTILCFIAGLLIFAPGLASADTIWTCFNTKENKEQIVNDKTRQPYHRQCKVLVAGGPAAAESSSPVAANHPATARWTPPVKAPSTPVTAPGAAVAVQAPGAQLIAAPKPAGRAAFDETIAKASRTYNIPEAFIRAVIEVESGYNPRALSRVGAMGMMQLMPGTARDMGVVDPWDPDQNIMGGTKLLRALANRFDGDMVKVLSAYHAGGGVTSEKDGTPWVGTDGYVRNILKRYYRIKKETVVTQ